MNAHSHRHDDDQDPGHSRPPKPFNLAGAMGIVPSAGIVEASWLVAWTLSFGIVTQVCADVKDGHAAYEQGDYAQAMAEFRSAAEQGDPAAQIAVGWLFDSGKGVARDAKAAIHWYLLAAEQGCAVAQQYLGTMYATGSDVPRDFEVAAKWFRAAAEQGEPGGLYGLGVMYRDGQGVPADSVVAYQWFTLAATQHSTDPNIKLAAAARRELRTRLSSEQVQRADAAALAWKATPSLMAPHCKMESSRSPED